MRVSEHDSDGRAEKITELSGNPKAHMDALGKDSDTKASEAGQGAMIPP